MLPRRNFKYLKMSGIWLLLLIFAIHFAGIRLPHAAITPPPMSDMLIPAGMLHCYLRNGRIRIANSTALWYNSQHNTDVVLNQHTSIMSLAFLRPWQEKIFLLVQYQTWFWRILWNQSPEISIASKKKKKIGTSTSPFIIHSVQEKYLKMVLL